MPQSFSQALLHVVFSTKNRAPFLTSPVLRGELHAYLIGALRTIDCPSLIMNSVEDHLHGLVRLSRTITIASLIHTMKVESSNWLKRQSPELSGFYWQNGYAAFSVSESNVEQVSEYIARQEEHHRHKSFQDEFRALLRRHRLEWDEQYVWD